MFGGDLLVRGGVAVDRHEVDVGGDAGAAELGADAVLHGVHEVHDVGVAVEAQVLVPHDVAERGEGLDLVADVLGGAGASGLQVVDEPEGDVTLGDLCTVLPTTGAHPAPTPVEVRLAGAPARLPRGGGVRGRGLLEGLVGELELVRDEEVAVHLEPGACAEGASLGEPGPRDLDASVAVPREERLDPLERGVAEGRVLVGGVEVLQRQGRVIARGGDDAGGEVPGGSGGRVVHERVDERLRLVEALLLQERTDPLRRGAVQALALHDRPHQRIGRLLLHALAHAVGDGPRRDLRRGLARLASLGGGEELLVRLRPVLRSGRGTQLILGGDGQPRCGEAAEPSKSRHRELQTKMDNR